MANGLQNLKHPLERTLFWLYVALNIFILLAAIYVARQGDEWLKTHSLWARYRLQIRAVASALVLGPPTVTFLRNTRHAQTRGNAVVVSPRQLAVLHQMLQRQCEQIGMNPPPELLFSDCAAHEASHAYKSWKQSYIVLNTTFMQPALTPMLPVFAFLLGRELGRLKLGHEDWRTDLLLSYTKRLPYLRNPLVRVFTYSEDRWGAYLARDGVTGLMAMAAGRRMLPDIDIDDYVRNARMDHGIWSSIAEFISEKPPLTHRINALARAGLAGVEARHHSSRT